MILVHKLFSALIWFPRLDLPRFFPQKRLCSYFVESQNVKETFYFHFYLYVVETTSFPCHCYWEEKLVRYFFQHHHHAFWTIVYVLHIDICFLTLSSVCTRGLLMPYSTTRTTTWEMAFSSLVVIKKGLIHYHHFGLVFGKSPTTLFLAWLIVPRRTTKCPSLKMSSE